MVVDEMLECAAYFERVELAQTGFVALFGGLMVAPDVLIDSGDAAGGGTESATDDAYHSRFRLRER